MTASDISPQAVTAAGNALRRRWLEQHPGIAALGLDPMDWARTALEAAAPHLAAAERERLLSPSPGAGSCCDLHGRNCEPGELCCERCTEADHPGHAQLGPCSTPVLSPNTLGEARRIAVAVAAERERCAQLAEKHHVQVILPGGTLGTGRRVPFADLLRQDGGT